VAENGKYFDFSSDEIIRIAELAVRGESRASHKDRRWAGRTRREEGKYRQYLTDEQRRSAGFSAGRMQRDFHHGLLGRRLWPRPARVAYVGSGVVFYGLLRVFEVCDQDGYMTRAFLSEEEAMTWLALLEA
jgi:hypothetical protein